MIDLMLRRRSIRKYTEEALTQKAIHKLLMAGLSAPSSMGKNPVEFVVVTEREAIASLKACKNRGTAALDTAPLVIAVLADRELSDVWVEDAAIAATYIFLMAESMGLGCNWIQMRRREGEELPSEEAVRGTLGIPESRGVLALLCIGHPDEVKPPHTPEDLNFHKVHHEAY